MWGAEWAEDNELEPSKVELYLDDFVEIETSAAKVLSKFEGDLWLYDLTSLSDAAARALSKCKRVKGINLKNLPDSAAKILRDAKKKTKKKKAARKKTTKKKTGKQ